MTAGLPRTRHRSTTNGAHATRISRIINAARRVDVSPVVKFASPVLRLILYYPDLPIDMVYPRVRKTDIAEVYLRDIGNSSSDHGRLLRNAMDWTANAEKSDTVSGVGVLDVTAWRKKESMTVHLMNPTDPMMMKGPLRRIFPVGAQIAVNLV